MKDYIIKKNYDISAIMAKHDSAANKYFIAYKTKNNTNHYRYAISIGKKYGNAVQRNRIKRQIRHIIQDLSGDIPANYDILIIVRPTANVLENYHDIEKQIKHVFKRANIIMREDRNHEN